MPFAEDLIGTHTALALTAAMQGAAPEARLASLRAAPDLLAPLSLRQRSDLLRDAILTDLPGAYADLASVVRTAWTSSDYFSGWLIWPVTSAIAQRAIQDGSDVAFDDAMALLAELTSGLSSEFAIRSLLRHNLDRALAIISSQWVVAGDVDVRRLASEGTRPYLPWATRVPGIVAEPSSTLPILSALYRDESEYVRRSVANHLNDISRDHADVAVATAREWLDDPDDNTERLVRHGMRTLIKRGHAGALELMGFRSTLLDVTGPTVEQSDVPIGGSVRFAASVTNRDADPARLSIDYAVHHRKANGTSTAKVFKLAVRSLGPGETIDISREHSFRRITTRTYYPGTHTIELLVNGTSAGRADFDLTASPE
jgi:3-methyladenine DNA glycosylase AlkC